MEVVFKNPETAAQYENTCEKDHSVIVLQCIPAYRGSVSHATPEACEQMIKDGVPYIRKRQLPKVPPVK